MSRQLRTVPNVLRGVSLFLRFYGRDFLRGPNAVTTFGYCASSIAFGLVVGIGLVGILLALA